MRLSPPDPLCIDTPTRGVSHHCSDECIERLSCVVCDLPVCELHPDESDRYVDTTFVRGCAGVAHLTCHALSCHDRNCTNEI